MRRKNTKRFDPRYFMDEKIDKGAAFCAEQEMVYDEELGKCVPPKIQQPDPSEFHEGVGDVGMYDFRGSEPTRVSSADEVEPTPTSYDEAKEKVKDYIHGQRGEFFKDLDYQVDQILWLLADADLARR